MIFWGFHYAVFEFLTIFAISVLPISLFFSPVNFLLYVFEFNGSVSISRLLICTFNFCFRCCFHVIARYCSAVLLDGTPMT